MKQYAILTTVIGTIGSYLHEESHRGCRDSDDISYLCGLSAVPKNRRGFDLRYVGESMWLEQRQGGARNKITRAYIIN